jgi:hypothetical protein
MKRSHPLLAFAAIGLALIGMGCGKTVPTGAAADARAKLRMVGIEYAHYLGQHNGAVPHDEAEFRTFVDSQIAQVKDYGVKSAEELLTSPRDGQAVKVILGEKVAPPDQPETPWAAYEHTGVDGKRLAVNIRGTVFELDAQQFAQMVPIK